MNWSVDEGNPHTYQPRRPKIYHIVHVDRLTSIIQAGEIWSDAKVRQYGANGTTIGMEAIKDRRLAKELNSHPGLKVGQCVPFYFAPRSVMLYLIHRANHPGLAYTGGQQSIIHLEADLHTTVKWANTHGRRWAFTLVNAAMRYCEECTDLNELGRVNWYAVRTRNWSAADVREAKQAEFLLETSFPWTLVRKIGHMPGTTGQVVNQALKGSMHRPIVIAEPDWYY